MRLTTMTQITLDGVMQGNGGNRQEERDRNGFERGGWARVLDDPSTDEYINDTYAAADAFLFGRTTYDLFAASWGSMSAADAPGWERTWQALHDRPKFVASTSLANASWSGTTVLRGDLASAITDLKAQPGGELQVHGSGLLVQWLLAQGLVDELRLIVAPVILGQGARLFPQDGPDIALELIESRADSSGATIQVFRPTDRPTFIAD